MGYEAEMHNMTIAISAKNCTINIVMDSLRDFSLHVTIGVVGPYHCPSQEEYVAYVASLGFGDNAKADQGGGQAIQEEAMEEHAAHDGRGDEGH